MGNILALSLVLLMASLFAVVSFDLLRPFFCAA
jgi:hypothetical protein